MHPAAIRLHPAAIRLHPAAIRLLPAVCLQPPLNTIVLHIVLCAAYVSMVGRVRRVDHTVLMHVGARGGRLTVGVDDVFLLQSEK